MINAEQFNFDYDKAEAERPLMEQWARNMAADAHNWTPEAMAMVWSLGRNDWEAWRQLPNYERQRITTAYQFEHETLEWRIAAGHLKEVEPVELPGGGGIWCKRVTLKHGRIRSYREACPPFDEKEFQLFMRSAQEMADQLARDWSANRPPSIFTCDRIKAGVVSRILGRPVEAVEIRDLDELNAEPSKRKRKAAK